jgi:hypothetical protein
MSKLIFIGVFLLSINATSQTTTTKQAVAITDSILRAKVGDRLYHYFSLSYGTYYTYVDRHKRQVTGKFLSNKKLLRSFSTLNFLYHFDYPEIKGVRGGLWLIVDKDFKLVDTLNFDFIPSFLTQHKIPDFISIDTALTIAKANFKQKGFEITTPELSYNDKLKQYTFTTYNKLTKTLNQVGKDSGEMEIVEINALTGKIERIDKGYYGLIIR